MSTTSAPDGTAFFGKVPTRGDFVRGGAFGEMEAELANWLNVLVEQARGVLPEGAVRFLSFRSPDRCAAGVWVPSCDEVGRAFPLAAFRSLPREVTACAWSVLPAYCEGFMFELEQCLQAGSTLDVDSLSSALRRVIAPHPSELPGILHSAREVAGRTRVEDFARSVFSSAPEQQLWYALGTMARAAQLPDEALTLDVLAPSSFELFVWLELLCAMLQPNTAPAMIAWSVSGGHALASLGEASDQLMVYLSDPKHRGSKRWPLWTEHIESVPVALASLPAALIAAVESNANLMEVLELARTLRSAECSRSS